MGYMNEETGQQIAALLRDISVKQMNPVIVHQHGCICPPKSEETCQGLSCPRRPMRFKV